MRLSLAWLGEIAGNLLGKWASSAMDSHYSSQVINKQLAAQKDLFEYENTHKHQFEVDDLRKAGLNPILSATNGQALGVGGISAPNWSSDDDVYGPSAARQLQERQIGVQERQQKVAEMLAEGELERNKTQSDLNRIEGNIKLMKADAELENIIADTSKKNAEVKLAQGKFEEAISAVLRNRADAKEKLESAVGHSLTNWEQKMFKELLEDPDIIGTPTYHGLLLAKKLNLSAADRYGLVLAVNAQKFRPKQDRNDSASSAKSVSDVDAAFNKFSIVD